MSPDASLGTTSVSIDVAVMAGAQVGKFHDLQYVSTLSAHLDSLKSDG